MSAASTRRAMYCRLVLHLILLMPAWLSDARELLVGGKRDSWKIPSAGDSSSLNQWARASRFQIGDVLVWVYNSKEDSVLRVSRNNYANCNISSPIAAYNDGNTTVKLEQAGPYYFVSGAKGHCQSGQKLIVVVISPRTTAAAPSPSTEFNSPAISPTTGGTAASYSYACCSTILATLLGIILIVVSHHL